MKKALMVAMSAVAAFVLAASSAEAAGSPSPANHDRPASGLVEVTENGIKSAWMSVEYAKTHPAKAKEYGISVPIAGSGKSPKSADHCHRDVCINVTGEGLEVHVWATTAFGNVGCSLATYLADERVYKTREVCPDEPGPGMYSSALVGYHTFHDKTWLCNTWLNMPGEPCIQIHK
ncbi:hypothetical protein GCM10010260_49280 [Streptomyces filipinensis]|uniref:Secreted protein n=1 Tax=Streptomyces filipinensis TaxID=66887 RepID=A0A918MC94_9ACTN|nr:hypothetical protein GCM10010260_49280 [Streptomyces filipinensis]